ncbi:MAG: nucleotidyltransferase domain-containing protein, partial [Bacteroidota bacterium]|nr:nucleotidyltransferase domain-containing protein [Bacteroidota bacterium]
MNENISTLPSPADKIISTYLDYLINLFGTSLKGVYITGSIALQDFIADKSDIDLSVYLEAMPNEPQHKQLHKFHKAIAHQYPYPPLHIIFLTGEIIESMTPTLAWREGRWRKNPEAVNEVFLFELKSTAI